MRAAQVHSTAPDRQASEVTAAEAHPTATEMHPPTAEVATSTAEMHATPAEVTTATAEVTAAATKAAACGFRGQRRRKGHHRRKQDRANSNSVAFHEYLPACECSAPLGCEHLSATPLEYRSIRPHSPRALPGEAAAGRVRSPDVIARYRCLNIVANFAKTMADSRRVTATNDMQTKCRDHTTMQQHKRIPAGSRKPAGIYSN